MYQITESEQIILDLLWEKGSLSIMQMVRELADKTNWTKHAVISFLKKMEIKGTVVYQEENRTKYYSAVPKRDEVIKEESKTFLNRFFDGKMGLMVSAMAKENQLSEEDIQDLRTVLQELKEHEKNQRD